MGMNDMFADMLKKAIPPEVAALLTEEKIKEFGARANGFVMELRGRLSTIEDTQTNILASIEELKNVNGNHSDGTGSKSSARRSGGGSGDK